MKTLSFTILMLFIFSVAVESSFDKYYDRNTFLDFYKELVHTPSRYNNIFLINKLFESVDSYNITSKRCYTDLSTFRCHSLNSTSLWPLMMLDASGGFQASLFQGNLNHLGDWDQCLSVKTKYFKTNPCQATIHLPYGPAQNSSYVYHNTPIIFNLCLPSSCNQMDLKSLLSDWSSSKNIAVDFKCTMRKKSSHYLTIGMIFIGVMLLIGSTAYDISFTKQGELNMWNVFSVHRNLNNLLSDKASDTSLSCLYGLKFITQIMVIWYHLIMQQLAVNQPIINKFIFAQILESWHISYYTALTLSVDTYLLMAGLLISYTTVSNPSKYKNLFKYYLHRYIRVTPSLFAVMTIYLWMEDFVCFGPLCSRLNREINNCYNFWWTNLLYVNNYYPSFKHTCLYHSWYLALDWQLYLISPLLLHFVSKAKCRTTYTVLLGLFIAAIAVPYVSTYMYSLPAQEFFLHGDVSVHNYYGQFYTPLQTRFGPWLVGFILGLLIRTYKSISAIQKSWLKTVGWITSGALMAVCLCVNVSYPSVDDENIIVNALNNALKKNCWAVSMAWIIFACYGGFSGIINKVLSWKHFQALGKLSYGAYLIHRTIIALVIMQIRSPLHYSWLSQIVTLTGVVVITYFLSLLLYLAIEAPFCNLDYVFLSDYSSKKKNKTN